MVKGRVSQTRPPNMAARQLGRRLAALRMQARLTQEDMAAELDVSVATVVRIEAGTTSVRKERVLLWCQHCRTAPAEATALMSLAEATRRKGLYQDSAVIPDWFGLYVDMEASCAEIEAWEPDSVHGLLQTEDYARALFGIAHANPDIREALVRNRLQRQERVIGPRRVTILMGWEALEIEVGSAEIMRAQVRHLRSLAGESNCYIGILTWQAGHRQTRGPFTILSFADSQDPDIAYVENDTGAVYLEKRNELEVYRQSFACLHRLSTPIKEYAT